MLHKCESVFMNPAVTNRVETKCFSLPEEDSLPTSITNRQLTPKPRSQPERAASELSHAHRWLPSSLFKPFKEERCGFRCSGWDVVAVEMNSPFRKFPLLIWPLLYWFDTWNPVLRRDESKTNCRFSVLKCAFNEVLGGILPPRQ